MIYLPFEQLFDCLIMEEMIIVSDIDIERKESIVCRAFNFRVIANLK